MRRKILLAVFAFLLVGCQRNAPASTPPTLNPTSAAPSAASTLPPSLLPTATALAEGLVAQFATPDPSPNCPEHYPWFFDNHASECATTVLNTWAVMQRFEHGIMVWFQEGGRTYVFLDDGSLFRPYQTVSDPSALELSGTDPNIVPPDGLYQPELGFAKFWRGLVPGSEWIRNRLGWALAPEVGYSALWQCNNAADSTARCYFSGSSDEIIGLTHASAQYWNYWQGPVR